MMKTNSPYENLANAIILRAVRDYRKALSRCNLHHEKDSYRQHKETIERFFSSNWFSILTGIDPEILITSLKAEVVA